MHLSKGKRKFYYIINFIKINGIVIWVPAGTLLGGGGARGGATQLVWKTVSIV